MIDTLTQAGNLPFAVALLLMVLIGLVEAVGLGLGAVDLDADADMDASSLLGWLGVGQVPLLILLVVFLAGFGLIGLGVQRVAEALTGAPLDLWLAMPTALVAALPVTGLLARGLARVLPQDETTAVSIDSLVGRRAVVALGTARRGAPAQARVRDRHDHLHHIMVEPAGDDARLAEGETVLLVERQGHLFYGLGEGLPLSPLERPPHYPALLRSPDR